MFSESNQRLETITKFHHLTSSWNEFSDFTVSRCFARTCDIGDICIRHHAAIRLTPNCCMCHDDWPQWSASWTWNSNATEFKLGVKFAFKFANRIFCFDFFSANLLNFISKMMAFRKTLFEYIFYVFQKNLEIQVFFLARSIINSADLFYAEKWPKIFLYSVFIRLWWENSRTIRRTEFNEQIC